MWEMSRLENIERNKRNKREIILMNGCNLWKKLFPSIYELVEILFNISINVLN